MNNYDKFTLENIVKTAQTKGLRYEAYSLMFDSFGSDSKYKGITMIGIELTNHVWHWFEIFSRKLDLNTYEWKYDDDAYIHFSHRYSQNTGKSIKSWKQGYRAKERIINLINNTK